MYMCMICPNSLPINNSLPVTGSSQERLAGSHGAPRAPGRGVRKARADFTMGFNHGESVCEP